MPDNRPIRPAPAAHAVESPPPRRQAGPADPCAMVLFGATGDLTKRLVMPALYNLSRTKFLLARLDQLWPRVPRYKPLSVGVVLLGLVPASRHQPDLFASGSQGHQQLSPLVDRITRRYGRCTIGFGLFPSEVREFKGHAAFRRVPESWEF